KQIKEADEYQRLLKSENDITSYDDAIHKDAVYTSRELSRYTILLPIDFIDIMNNNGIEIDEKDHNDDDDNDVNDDDDEDDDDDDTDSSDNSDYGYTNSYSNYFYGFLYEKTQSYNFFGGNNKIELNL